MRFGPFFVIRSPLLESTFAAADEIPTDALANPEVKEALQWSSSSLAAAASGKTRERNSVQLSICRYVARMKGRPTPFGLMAGYTTGRVQNQETKIQLAPRGEYRRVVRLDLDAVQRLLFEAAHAQGDGARWSARADILRLPDSVRVSTRNADGSQVTNMDIARSPALDAILAAADNATLSALVSVASPYARTASEAASFLRALIDNGLLVPADSPSVLVRDEIEPLRRSAASSAAADVMTRIRTTPLSETLELDAALQGVGLDRSDLIVDLVKPAVVAELGKDVTSELLQVIALLQRFEPSPRDPRLVEFTQRFLERYEGREVPLPEALDPRRGLGFAVEAEGPPAVADSARSVQMDRLRAKLFADAAREGRDVALSDALLAREKTWEVPAFFSCQFSLYRDPMALWSPRLSRSPGTLLYARGTAVLPEPFASEVSDGLALADANDPEHDTCDIAYFVPGKSAAFAQFPPLQPFVIALSGARRIAANVIDINDIDVLVERGAIRLRRRSNGRFLKVRRTGAAQADRQDTTDLFRFLAALSSDTAVTHGWSWGALSAAPELPRVTYRHHVLSPRSWILDTEETKPLRSAKTQSERWSAVQELRRARKLPRYLRFHEKQDLLLPVDLDDRWSVDAWVDIASERMRVSEAFDVARSAVVGPEGPYHHEIVIPISGAKHAEGRIQRTNRAAVQFDDVVPGGRVLYARIIGDPDELLPLLHELVNDVIAPQLEQEKISGWFFLPYTKSDNELRIRIFGEPERLWSPDVLGRLKDAIDPRVKSRAIRAMKIDTYERETYRYGGSAGMSFAEALFQISSDIALRLHAELDFLADGDPREYFVPYIGSLLGILGSAGLTLDEQLEVARDAAAGYRRGDEALVRQVGGDLYRQLRREVLAAGKETLLGKEVHDLEALLVEVRAEKTLTVPFAAWLRDCLHVHSLRLLTTWHPAPHVETAAYETIVRALSSLKAVGTKPQ